jgi:hypothetical protein
MVTKSATNRSTFRRFNNAAKRLVGLAPDDRVWRNGSWANIEERIGPNETRANLFWLFETYKRHAVAAFRPPPKSRDRYADAVRCSVRIIIEPVDRDETEVLIFVASAYEDGKFGFTADGFNPADPDHRAFAEATELPLSSGEWGMVPSDPEVNKLITYLNKLEQPQ